MIKPYLHTLISACIDAKIPRLLVISSGAVSRPDSLGYKARGLI
jgi:hypothetical protein